MTSMRWRVLYICSLALPSLGGSVQAQDARLEGDLLGFTSSGAARQLELETRFDSQLNPDQLREWMQYITSKPVYVGSPHNKETADWLVDQFRSWGFVADLRRNKGYDIMVQ